MPKRHRFKLLFYWLVITGLLVAPIAHAQEAPCSGDDIKLGDCIVNIYQWALGIAVLLALIMIIIAGYQYITAGGNAQTVAEAKDKLTSALIGLVLLFAAVLILRTINPDLVDLDFTPPQVQVQPRTGS